MRFFSCAPFLYDTLLNSEKKPPVHLQKPNRFVHGVIETVKFTMGIGVWFEVISQDHGRDHLRALQSCHVTCIEHHRSSQGTICHELVIVYIQSGNDEEVRAGKADSRVMVIERFKQRSSSTIECIRHSVQECNSGNADLITIGADLKDACPDINSKYGLIQKFDIPLGKMDIIHCASLGLSIMQSAENYSTLYHMCHWSAALFFHTARSLCMGDDSDACLIEHGPLYADRGKVASVRLVTDNCALLPGGALTLDHILKQVHVGMMKEGMTQGFVTAFETTFRADIEAMDKNPELKKAPVQQMLISNTMSMTVRGNLEKADSCEVREHRVADREREVAKREQRLTRALENLE
ncbi:uncharacterized protein EV420DRAFT_1560041 [Desarmillaria tabescens]|uniref:Uncharacterized protein n=1 Tax=Armillaria tabescens TaxID=1929756 RepID=A0AA39MYZ4_ARMTA|nr:uncharacterized protein EV420DRAFT_1560041 [Desarmillaria tabescens]KAK0451279.1 hypothetical protein EV420DRAFT_1560041 [Desarmillaria tabescens]